MTTTSPTATDAHLRKIAALRDRALHASANEHEADTAMTMARKLCDKYGVSHSFLDAKPDTSRRTTAAGTSTPARTYTCRFGCGMFTQHTAEEMSACADKARAASATGNAYANHRDPFEDLFGKGWANAGRSHGEPKAKRNGTHAYCSHEATKSARAKCRRERGY